MVDEWVLVPSVDGRRGVGTHSGGFTILAVSGGLWFDVGGFIALHVWPHVWGLWFDVGGFICMFACVLHVCHFGGRVGVRRSLIE